MGIKFKSKEDRDKYLDENSRPQSRPASPAPSEPATTSQRGTSR